MTKHKYDNIQKDKIQIWHITKRQKTNVKKYNQVLLKCDKMQKDRIQIWQNAKGQNTKVTK